MKSTSITLSAAILLSACKTPADPPSLLPRAIERRQMTTAPAPPPTTSPPADAALTAQLARLISDAKAGDADFTTVEQKNAKTLSAGQRVPAGSEAWIAAEMAKSALISASQKSADALADIDALAVTRAEQASRDGAVGGLREILSMQAEINTIVERQAKRLAEFSR